MNQNKRKTEIELQLKKINDREKQLKAQMRAIDAREKEAARKKETRAKIILGGYLVSQVRKGNPNFKNLYSDAINNANERDKSLLIELQGSITKGGK